MDDTLKLAKIFLFFFLSISVFAEEYDFTQKYELGQGYRINDALNIGAYFSLDYANGKNIDRMRLDDVAVLAYGSLSSKWSYFVELEASPLYLKDFKNNTSEFNERFYIERSYVNYLYSDFLNFRAGKLITPIGYWNLVPINVLRDTTSNPLYSYRMFPKFLSGLDVSGYGNSDATLEYHCFLQVSDDIDEDYINIKNDFFLGASLSYDISYEWNLGASVGYVKAKQDPVVNARKRDISFVEGNAKYENYPFLVQTEWAYTYIDNKEYVTTDYQFGGYVQGMYNLNEQHALVSRYEYFKDTQLGLEENRHIGIIAYSYRPVYALSIKGEYQFHSDSYYNQAFISLSVLF